ncbi:hypothetical protein C8R44DRAFT_882028 [Mycena epipterygia]|nr:hypothetical protein C8R44DRAFT_882028 [Mycena epipterygia]
MFFCAAKNPRAQFHLFYVVDEAQLASRENTGAFKHESKPYSFLREIIQRWAVKSQPQEASFVVLGMDIPKDGFESAPFARAIRWTSDTGGFDDEAEHRRYLSRFLTPSYRVSPAGKMFLQCVRRWCSGRYRSTDALIKALIDRFKTPHKLLNDYIETTTTHRPTDYEDDESLRYPIDEWMSPLLGRHQPNATSRSFTSFLTFYLTRAFDNGANTLDGVARSARRRGILPHPKHRPRSYLFLEVGKRQIGPCHPPFHSTATETILQNLPLKKLMGRLAPKNLLREEGDDEDSADHTSVVAKLLDTTQSDGTFCVLRVITSFPAQTHLKTLPAPETSKPVGNLNTGLFQRLTEDIPVSDVLERLADAVTMGSKWKRDSPPPLDGTKSLMVKECLIVAGSDP